MHPSEKLLRALQHSSERRLDLLWSPKVADKARQAAHRLRRARKLRTFVLQPGQRPPPYVLGSNFKYTHSWGGGSLDDALAQLHRGQPVTIAGVMLANTLVGYGIARECASGVTGIEIIDVSAGSRRSSGISAGFTFHGKKFTVGIGHIVVVLLVETVSRPVRTDATHDSSRYVFKSLGFVTAPDTHNECILHLV